MFLLIECFTLCWQSLVLYGVYPYVVERLCGVVVAGSRVSLRVFFDGNFLRVDCHSVDDVEVKSFTLATWPMTVSWKEEVLQHVVTLLSCMDPVPSLCAVVVDDHMELCRAFANWTVPSSAVSMRAFDVNWVQRCCRQQFKQRIGGLDPYNVLDFLKHRLGSAVNGPEFDRLPLLRHVRGFSSFVRKKKKKCICSM